MVRTLKAERALVLYGPDMQVRAAHGLDSEAVFNGERISLGLFEDVRRKGTPLVVRDAKRDQSLKDYWSLQLSDIQSLVCVPVLDASGTVAGLLYADSRVRVGSFGNHHLSRLVDYASRLERALFDGESLVIPAAPAQAPAPRIRQVKLRRGAAGKSRNKEKGAAIPSRRGLRLSQSEKVVLLRSLSLMIQSGVTLQSGLSLLANSKDYRSVSGVSSALLDPILRGHKLSEAMQALPEAFTSFQIRLVRVGETSGSLPQVLGWMADYEERTAALLARVKSALTYPAAVLAVTCALLLIGPPWILQGQIQIIKSSQVELPAISRFLILVADLVLNPIFLAGLAVGLVGLAWTLRSMLGRPERRLKVNRRLLSWPLVGPVLKSVATTRFCQALAVQLKAGVSVAEGIKLSAQACAQPALEARLDACIDSLHGGANLSESLAQFRFFPPTMLGVMLAGEESGEIPRVLDWYVRLLETELEASIATMVAAVEPLVLALVGGVVGFTVLGTMLPIIKMLEVL